jgi:hypothetical protein
MSDDFQKGMRNDTSDVSNFAEFERGRNYQLDANARSDGLQTKSPHSPGIVFASNSPQWVISGTNPILQFIVCIPFILVGMLLYPITAAATLIATLLCTRLVPLFGAGATWERALAFIPALVVFWFCMRWDVHTGDRNRTYRRARHVARVLVFGALGYAIAERFIAPRGSVMSIPRLGGAGVGLLLGHLFLVYGHGWRDFWHATLARMRIQAA